MVVIASRFRGPPNSGNGGYACGLLAEFVDGIAEVTLRKPPPLDVPLSVESNGATKMRHESALVGEARPTELDFEIPEPPSFEEAQACVERYVGFRSHPFPTCFTCGPERAAGDGLRIFPGRLEGRPLVAAPWQPHAADAGDDGFVRRPILWAAIDCPGYFGTAGERMELAVLGRMAAEVRGDVPVGERCVVIGWSRGIDGRKRFAGSALFNARGELLGRAAQTWVALRGE
jgi:hypothetical protein